jgi:catechol 2,3-dioxygenase-like lactoylglutathione lyase family enzyme
MDRQRMSGPSDGDDVAAADVFDVNDAVLDHFAGYARADLPTRPILMWVKPFFISGNCALDVRNLAASRDWYKEKLGLREALNDREDDSGRPFVDLCISSDNAFLSLVELAPGADRKNEHVIFFTKNLEKAHQWLAGRGVSVEPPTSDSGGNCFFRFKDLEGNAIEVCVEPG